MRNRVLEEEKIQKDNKTGVAYYFLVGLYSAGRRCIYAFVAVVLALPAKSSSQGLDAKLFFHLFISLSSSLVRPHSRAHTTAYLNGDRIKNVKHATKAYCKMCWHRTAFTVWKFSRWLAVGMALLVFLTLLCFCVRNLETAQTLQSYSNYMNGLF